MNQRYVCTQTMISKRASVISEPLDLFSCVNAVVLGLGGKLMNQLYVHTKLELQNCIGHIGNLGPLLAYRGGWIGVERHVNEPTISAHKL